MGDGRLERVQSIFAGARALPPEERSRFLGEACDGDPDLRREVEELLAADRPDSLLGVRVDMGGEGAPRAPAQIGSYRILRVLGAGGMGSVYEAEQARPHRVVALKVVRAGFVSDQARRRFELEAEVLGRLEHPGIARVYEAGTAQTDAGLQPYFAMELVRGEPLIAYADAHHLDVTQRLGLFARVCEAVQYAHQQGIIHRDLKPSNILVEAGSQPKVLDFGVAKATGSDIQAVTLQTEIGQIIGTLEYMSPEQATGDPQKVDTRSDVYALGVLAYELLSGRLPLDLRGQMLHAAVRAIQEEEPARLSSINRRLKGDLETVVGKALEKDKERRYQSARELAGDLGRYLRNEPIAARAPSTPYLARKWVRKHRLPVQVVCFAGVLLLATVGVATTLYRQQKALAVESARKARQVQVDAHVADAAKLLDAGDSLRALGPLGGALDAAGGDAAMEEPLRLAIGGILRYSPRLVLQAYGATADLADSATVHFAFSADGHKIVSNSNQHADVWDADTGRRLCPSLAPQDYINYAFMSADGRLVATTGSTAKTGNATNIYDADSGRLITSIHHDAAVFSADFSRDNQRLLLGGDGFVRVWDLKSGRPVAPVIATGMGAWASFSPDGTRVATCSKDKTARVWNAQTSQPISEPMVHGDTVWTAWFSPDGQRVLTCSDDHTAQVWDARTGQRIGKALRHDDIVYNAFFSPDGSRVVTASADHTARVWDAATGEPVSPSLKHAGGVPWAAFSPDGRRVVTGSFDKTARVWDAVTGEALSAPLPHADTVWRVRFHPDGRRVFTMDRAGLLRGWELPAAPPPPPHPLPPGPTEFTDWGFSRFISPDGRCVLIMYSMHSFQLWDNATCEPLGPVRTTEQNLGYTWYSADSRRVAVTVYDWSKTTTHAPGQAIIYDTATGEPIGQPIKGSGGVSCASFLGDGDRVLVTTPDGTHQVWDYAVGQAVCPPLHETSSGLTSAAPDGRHVMIMHPDNTCRFWDIKTGRPTSPVLAQVRRGDDLGVFLCKFTPASRRAVSYSWDNSLGIWEVGTGKAVVPPFTVTATSYLEDFAVTPDGRYVATAANDHAIRVWDANKGAPVGPLIHAPGRPLAISVTPDGNLVAVGCDNGSAEVWDVHTGLALTPPLWHANPVWAVHFSTDQHCLITTSWGHPAQEWDITPDTRPTQDLIQVAQLLSATTIGTHDTPHEDAVAIDKAWVKLRSQYLGTFNIIKDPASQPALPR